MCQQRKEAKENYHPLFYVVGKKTATNEEKVQVLNDFFAQSLITRPLVIKVPHPLN